MQPELTLFLFQHELDSIDEYSASIPSGTTVGKVWKSNRNIRRGHLEPNWVVCMYTENANPELITILRFNVVLKHGPAPRTYREPDWSNFAAWKKEMETARETRS